MSMVLALIAIIWCMAQEDELKKLKKEIAELKRKPNDTRA